ncbi:MAG: prepilin-type N-terminal cleavage/methylation domain-containing protein [Candidatus Omnitrophota bacterium]|nr:prepilin-type N-terminal cleavage/methylation domain-containing protein [Candidatus Omnitrophota bacterium]
MLKKNRGVSLVELVVVIVIVGVLVGVSSMYIVETINLWQFLTYRHEVVAQGRGALMRMIREMRQIAPPVSAANSASLGFNYTDASGTTAVTYQLSGTNLMRNSDILAANVNSLNFTYMDSASSILATPVALPEQIYRIKVALGISSGGQSNTLESQVFPRNY